MLSRNDIFAPAFPLYHNGNMYKLDWLKRPKFKCNSQVDIGIDQSSTSSGLCIQGEDLLAIMELPRGDTTLAEYKKALTYEFDALFDGLNIRHFIYEKHGRHISPLHALINEVTDEIKTYTKPMVYDDVIVKGILPPVWRSGFLQGDSYKGRHKREEVKLAVVEEAVKRRPELKIYIPYAHKKADGPDYDGFESFGIVNGYLDLNYTSTGQRIINTSMEFRNGRQFRYILEKTDDMDYQSDLVRIKKKYGSFSCPVLLGNNNLLLDNSFNRILDDYKEAIVEIPKDSPELPRLIIETNQEFSLGDRFIAYVRAV